MEASNYSKVPNGKICYMIIPSSDIRKSSEFYHAVFGWNIRTRGDGSIAFDDVPNGVSGTWELNRKPHNESGLVVYIMVDDVASILKSVVSNGGRISEPVTGKLPELYAKFADPSGNIFGLGQE
jgi:predicted enzyme related to lactoylglutathione lyase